MKIHCQLSLSLSSLIYAVFYICYINIPALWLGIQSFSESFSGIIGRVVGAQLIIGPTISGTFILLTFILCTVAFFILSEKRAHWKTFVFSIIGLILIYTLFVAAHATILATGGMAMDNLYIAFLMFGVAFIFIVRAFEIKSTPIVSLAFRKIDGAAVVAIFFSLILISIFPYTGDGSTGKVVIYERNCEMGFDLPRFPQGNESFEPYNSFSVRGMGLYLEKMGYIVEDLNRTNPHSLKDALKDANVLMLINLNKSFSSDDLESIWNFVNGGGNLIAFGDHTSMFASDEDFKLGKDYLNEVLLPTGIRFNPDTADYVTNHWTYADIFLPHYVAKDLGFEITTSSVGASLSLSGNARPVVIGRYSFSDKPNATVPGHLGNRTYDLGEKIGDLILVASNTYGKGNVLVFGDTSYIFSSEVPFRYKLARDSILWLMSRESKPLVFLPWISLIILGVLALGYLFKGQPNMNTTLFNAIIAIAILLSLVISGSLNNSLVQIPGNVEKDIAWIDYSHLNQFNLNNYEANSVDGLITNLYRNKYMPPGERRIVALVIVLALGSLAVSGAVFLLSTKTQDTIPSQFYVKEHTVCFDGKHSGTIVSKADKSGSYETFFIWTQRVNLTPAIEDNFESAMEKGRILVIIDPIKELFGTERDALLNYVKEGNSILLMLDPNGPGSYLTQSFGMDTYYIGQPSNASNLTLDQNITHGLPLKPWGLAIKGGKPLISIGNRTVMAEANYGKGKFVLFTDSQAFRDGFYGEPGYMGYSGSDPNLMNGLGYNLRSLYNLEYSIFEGVLGIGANRNPQIFI